MTPFQITEEKTTIRNLVHCAQNYAERDPKRAEALLEEAQQREAVLNKLGESAVPKPAPVETPPATPAVPASAPAPVGDLPTDSKPATGGQPPVDLPAS